MLSPKESESSTSPITHGAAFWPLIPLLFSALLQLSQVYAHHGLFIDADYYAERIFKLVESVGAKSLIARARVHQSRLLTLANRLEEADLVITKCDELQVPEGSLGRAYVLGAKAALRAEEGLLDEALPIFEDAEACIRGISAVPHSNRLDSFGHPSPATLHVNSEAVAIKVPQKKVAGRTAVKSAGAKLVLPARPTYKAGGVRANKSVQGSNIEATETILTAIREPILLSTLRRNLMCERAAAMLRQGHDISTTLLEFEGLPSTSRTSSHLANLRHRQLMQTAAVKLQSDVALSMLPESTLAIPALSRTSRRGSSGPRTKVAASKKDSLTRASKRGIVAPKTGAEDLVLAARDCLLADQTTKSQLKFTYARHSECSLLSSANLLLSGTSLPDTKDVLRPAHQAHCIEVPRSIAWSYEKEAIHIESARAGRVEAFAWPGQVNIRQNVPMLLDAHAFQIETIDILLKPWTAVSLSLSEDCSELFIVRYRSAQEPFILRLPFSRNKPDDADDEEPFDYAKGKAELQDIISISNYSCHNMGNLEGKGAKSNWWAEREALDKRLHELLINIENIWLGGFKAALSLHQSDKDAMGRFRKAFDDVLGRYLPSRQATRGREKALSLSSHILELFIGLGSDQAGAIDLDEPIADLLYFFVDMLQFNGERNAYDEIDFDGMTVDVLDALRAYHDAVSEETVQGQHLILILDKRLQNFPWESMPYLQGSSVSRVGSMVSLQERILAMRRHVSPSRCDNLPADAIDCHVVSRISGTYILNPSGDLTSTQTTLSPALTKLPTGLSSSWTAVVQRAPSETEFTTALSQSSMLLYFGHGGGSQYVRPKAIKRLESCSEVVWLMGCSSGAVTEYGQLEPFAVPLAYLQAASQATTPLEEDVATTESGGTQCMAVVATLWDVTDKDIDRFSLAMGEEWGLFSPSEASKLPPAKVPKKKTVQLAAPSTPQQVPKTPKARKTPAPAKTPARSCSRGPPKQVTKRSLVEAVARSRDACYLRYLNGAAPVMYGVPVYLAD